MLTYVDVNDDDSVDVIIIFVVLAKLREYKSELNLHLSIIALKLLKIELYFSIYLCQLVAD